MPVTYSVHANGHFIHAIAESPLTAKEFVDYEVAHAIDNRIKAPVAGLLEVGTSALGVLGSELH